VFDHLQVTNPDARRTRELEVFYLREAINYHHLFVSNLLGPVNRTDADRDLISAEFDAHAVPAPTSPLAIVVRHIKGIGANFANAVVECKSEITRQEIEELRSFNRFQSDCPAITRPQEAIYLYRWKDRDDKLELFGKEDLAKVDYALLRGLTTHIESDVYGNAPDPKNALKVFISNIRVVKRTVHKEEKDAGVGTQTLITGCTDDISIEYAIDVCGNEIATVTFDAKLNFGVPLLAESKADTDTLTYISRATNASDCLGRIQAGLLTQKAIEIGYRHLDKRLQSNEAAIDYLFARRMAQRNYEMGPYMEAFAAIGRITPALNVLKGICRVAFGEAFAFEDKLHRRLGGSDLERAADAAVVELWGKAFMLERNAPELLKEDTLEKQLLTITERYIERLPFRCQIARYMEASIDEVCKLLVEMQCRSINMQGNFVFEYAETLFHKTFPPTEFRV